MEELGHYFQDLAGNWDLPWENEFQDQETGMDLGRNWVRAGGKWERKFGGNSKKILRKTWKDRPGNWEKEFYNLGENFKMIFGGIRQKTSEGIRLQRCYIERNPKGI